MSSNAEDFTVTLTVKMDLFERDRLCDEIQNVVQVLEDLQTVINTAHDGVDQRALEGQLDALVKVWHLLAEEPPEVELYQREIICGEHETTEHALQRVGAPPHWKGHFAS